MTNDPNQPFQPPRPPPQPPPGQGPPPSGGGTGGSAFVGVILGLGVGIIGPPVLWGMVIALLQNAAVPAPVQVAVPLVATLAIAAAYIYAVKRLDKNAPQQAAMRTALVVTGYISLAFWAVALILVGLCFAILAEAY